MGEYQEITLLIQYQRILVHFLKKKTCIKKITYQTKLEARKSYKYQRKIGIKVNIIYQCMYCDKYHLSSGAGRKEKNRRKFKEQN